MVNRTWFKFAVLCGHVPLLLCASLHAEGFDERAVRGELRSLSSAPTVEQSVRKSQTLGELRESARYSQEGEPGDALVPPQGADVLVQPISLGGGSTLTIITPSRWSDISERLVDSLRHAHEEYARLFGALVPVNVTFRLMERRTFLEHTGAPEWTNALYFRKEILIPLNESRLMDQKDLIRSVRHEYLHSVIHALSGGRCPGWLDEGLAQWAEGTQNPALYPALVKWIRLHEPVSLALLQGGFTKLQTQMVPAAYAQSLFASNLVTSSYGFASIRRYFDYLRAGHPKNEAFARGFGVSESSFERGLISALKEWEARYNQRVRF